MKIAIIGTGNLGGVLASKWAHAGHDIFLGVRDQNNFKGSDLVNNPLISCHAIVEAVQKSDIILLAAPAVSAIEVAQSLGTTKGKVIIDAMNVLNDKGPVGFSNTTDAILTNTETKDVVKCFNTTGYNNLKDPSYRGETIDLFTCGDSSKGKEIAIQLAKDAGFETCYDIGGNDKFQLMEQFAHFWINLAMTQDHGREIGFKLLKR